MMVNKQQLATRGIKHWGIGVYSNNLPRIKFGVTGQFSSPQSPTFHTANVSTHTKTNDNSRQELTNNNLIIDEKFDFIYLPLSNSNFIKRTKL